MIIETLVVLVTLVLSVWVVITAVGIMERIWEEED
jgi:hypothetical protein